MRRRADRHINPGRFNIAVPQHIGQMREILFNGIKDPSKQVTKAMRIDLARIHLRRGAQFFHRVVDI